MNSRKERRLIVQQFVSLDGFAAGKGDSIEFIGNTAADREMNEYALKMLKGIDTILLGRKTYQMFVEYWPEQTTDTELIADKLNGTPKIVFSDTLEEAPWGRWEPAEIEDGDAVKAVRKLKKEDGQDIILWGSLTLAEALAKAGLVDEYQLRVIPAVLGEGRTFIPAGVKLELLDTTSFTPGVVVLRYTVK